MGSMERGTSMSPRTTIVVGAAWPPTSGATGPSRHPSLQFLITYDH